MGDSPAAIRNMAENRKPPMMEATGTAILNQPGVSMRFTSVNALCRLIVSSITPHPLTGPLPP